MRDPLRSPLADGPASGRAPGLNLPLLPTLLVALGAAALSFVCQDQASRAPAPSVARTALAEPFHVTAHATATVEAPARMPAAAAFAQAFPIVAEPRPMLAVLPPPRPSRIAGMPAPRRACPGTRCPETTGAIRKGGPASTAADPFASARQSPSERAEAAETEVPVLPDLALPFAPAARVVGEAAGIVRGGAAAIGTSVSLVVDRLR